MESVSLRDAAREAPPVLAGIKLTLLRFADRRIDLELIVFGYELRELDYSAVESPPEDLAPAVAAAVDRIAAFAAGIGGAE